MLKPPALRPGDRVAVVAPASPFTRDEFNDGIAELARLGFDPTYDESVFSRRAYVAGDAAVRAAALRKAWADPDVRAIVAVRGGYGSVHVLPLIDPAEIRRQPKIFVGYSDLTSLLIYLTITCGVTCFHGPMLARKLGGGERAYDRLSFIRSLTRAEPLGELSAPGLESIRQGEARGVLLGGTLTQILASLGTPYAFVPPPGYVLFLDEVGERPYRLDRMLTQLWYSGLLSRASAVVVGELPSCDEAGGEPTGRSVFADLLSEFPGPVLLGFPSGHTTGPSLTLPLGVMCRVVSAGPPRIIIEEPAVQ
jgi:muramoyltetrapeptide carboxypeptidase